MPLDHPDFLFLSLTVPPLLPFRFVGRPGSYVYVFDGYRMEEASRAPGVLWC